jgi:hypothetical protein
MRGEAPDGGYVRLGGMARAGFPGPERDSGPACAGFPAITILTDFPVSAYMHLP